MRVDYSKANAHTLSRSPALPLALPRRPLFPVSTASFSNLKHPANRVARVRVPDRPSSCAVTIWSTIGDRLVRRRGEHFRAVPETRMHPFKQTSLIFCTVEKCVRGGGNDLSRTCATEIGGAWTYAHGAVYLGAECMALCVWRSMSLFETAWSWHTGRPKRMATVV